MEDIYDYLKNSYGISKEAAEKMADALINAGTTVSRPKKEYFKRITLDDLAKVAEVANDSGDITYSITQKISAQVINMTDKAMIDAIINCAREAGINELFLIDKEFIITAITNELRRRDPSLQYQMDTRFDVKLY